MDDNFFLKLIKEVEPNYDELKFPKTNFLDTGAYALNALLSASIYGGFADNRVTAITGEAHSGKSWFCLSAAKAFLDNHPDGGVLWFDTENASADDFFSKREIRLESLFPIPVDTLEQFRTKCIKLLESYEKRERKTPLMIVLDSLTMLPSNKEVSDASEGKDTRDMTKQQITRSIFRVLIQKLGRLNVPIFLTAHQYTTVGSYIPTKTMAGGGGPQYAASTIFSISKSKDRGDDKHVVGNILKVKSEKSRFSQEAQQVELRLNFKNGLDRYYGLTQIAEEMGIFKKLARQYELPDGTKVFGKNLEEEPEKYFTKEILDRIDEGCRVRFGLGVEEEPEIETDITE